MSSFKYSSDRTLYTGELQVYEQSPANEADAGISRQYGLLVNGSFRKPRSRRYLNTLQPGNGTRLCKVAAAGKRDINQAVEAASSAFKRSWSGMQAAERGKYLFRIAEQINRHSRELAILESLDSGIPIRQTLEQDLPLAEALFFHYAGWADKLTFAFPSRTVAPAGVAALIADCRSPLASSAGQLAPALAAGNTVILKACEYAPLSTLRLGELILESGLPDGVVNILTGDVQCALNLAGHKGIDTLTFSGPDALGKKTRIQMSRHGKHPAIRLTGTSSSVVMEDAAVNQAAENLVHDAFMLHSHQSAGGVSALVQESVADELAAKIRLRMSSLVIGNPLAPNTDVGPLRSETDMERLSAVIEQHPEHAGDITRHKTGLPSKGFWHEPVFIDRISASHPLLSEPVSGPVLSLQTFRTTDEALAMASTLIDPESVSVWSNSGSKSLYLASRLQANNIRVNSTLQRDPDTLLHGSPHAGPGPAGGFFGLTPYLETS